MLCCVCRAAGSLLKAGRRYLSGGHSILGRWGRQWPMPFWPDLRLAGPSEGLPVAPAVGCMHACMMPTSSKPLAQRCVQPVDFGAMLLWGATCMIP